MLTTTNLQRKAPEPKLTSVPVMEQDWAKPLLDVVRHFDQMERPVREKQIRKWRKQMCYWDGLQYLWWSELVHDWRTPEQASSDLQGISNEEQDMDPALYAKVINIYRAHGEVVIAAMSSSIPKTVFPPDDADNPDDVLSAKSKTKLCRLIERHNYAELLLTQALFILYNQGLVCGYNETIEHEDFGTVDKEIQEDVKSTRRSYMCPNCGGPLGEETLDSDKPIVGVPPQVEETSIDGGSDQGVPEETQDEPEMPSDQPDEEVEQPELPNVLPANNSPHEEVICQNCSQRAGDEIRVTPEFEDYDEIASEVTGYETINKCREIITLWGPLNVKVPAWIKRMSDSPYLILETEVHYAMMQDIYPEIAQHIKPTVGPDSYGRTMRTPNPYLSDTPSDLVTVARCWLRPWALNVLGVDNEDTMAKIQDLKKRCPKGIYVVIINDSIIAEVVEDKLDDHWTLTHHPLSDTIHAEPMGAPLMPVQELTNELVNLTVENIEHTIPETFVESAVIDWDVYRKSEARPGMMTPVTKTPGESLGNAFHEVKAGTLSKEVELFGDRLEKFSQFVVGSLPSVFGGQIDGGSGTAKEYEMSRAQALQRLSTTWRLITTWWTQLIGKAVTAYADSMIEDEHYTEPHGSGNYINVWIKRASLQGKVGNAYAEASESLPVSWNEKRSILVSLLTMQNPMIDAVIADPENSGMVARTVGLPEIYIPGDQDRNKQLVEISKLILEQPIEIDAPPDPNGFPAIGPDGQPATQTNSSVDIDFELDNHTVEAKTCEVWLKSEVGMDMKETNPPAYLNVLLHFKAHKAAEAQQSMMMQQTQGQEESGPEEKSDDNNVQEIPANA